MKVGDKLIAVWVFLFSLFFSVQFSVANTVYVLPDHSERDVYAYEILDGLDLGMLQYKESYDNLFRSGCVDITIDSRSNYLSATCDARHHKLLLII